MSEDDKKPEGDKTFPESYVKELREENKQTRLKATELETKLNEILKQKEETEKAKAEEQGKFKELFESESEKAKRLELELNTIKEESQSYKEKFETFEKGVREELLSQLSDEHKTIANELPIDKLKEYVKLNSVKTKYDTSRTGGMGFTIEGKNWTDFSTKELETLKEKNPEHFKKLYNNYLINKK